MLKPRQEGLTTLHATWIGVIVALLYFAFVSLLNLTGWIAFTENANLWLYFAAVCVGLVMSYPSYRHYSYHLANLRWLEAARLTKQQILRIGLVVFVIAFATKDAAISRLFIGSFLVLTCIVLLLGNYYLPRLICRFLFKSSTIPTLIVGNIDNWKNVEEWVQKQASIGIEAVGFLTGQPESPTAPSLPVLGSYGDLHRVLVEKGIAMVILIKESFTPEEIRAHIATAQNSGCRIRIYNNYEKEFNHPVVFDQDGPHTFFTLDKEPLENPINRGLKRALDIAVALPVVAFVLPLLTALVWFFQRRQAPGPIFYKQPRAGLTQQTFEILKFRTMYIGNAAVARQASLEDDRVFSFGRFLRRTSLDEMPQFINVLLGEMSVAGPRPHLREHDRIFSTALSTYYTRHYVKPGITGLAQCKGYRGEILNQTLLHNRVKYDVMYINQWSLLLDLQIIFLTFKQVLAPPDSAY